MQLNQHLVLYYSSAPALWQTCAEILAQSLDAGWAWGYIADEHAPAQVFDALHLPQNFDAANLLRASALPFHDSPFRVSVVASALREWVSERLKITRAQGMVLCIEMTWALRTPSGDVYLREYEAAIDTLRNELPLTVICLYDEQVMLDAQLTLALHTHSHILGTDGLYTNPHFIPPPLYARRDERAIFHYRLHSIHPTLHSRDTVPPSSTSALYPPTEFFPQMQADSAEQRWKIRCLGVLRVYRQNGAPIQWQSAKGATRKTKTLFAYLLHRGEQGARAQELADLLWPQADERNSMNRLYHVVNSLRQVLQGDTRTPRQSPFLLHHDQHYRLALPPHTWIDYPLFQELCYRAANLQAQNSLEQALLCFQSAERLYTGDYMQDIPNEYAENPDRDWCWSRRYWFREMYIKMLANLSEIHRRMNQLAPALEYADKALTLDPCSELANREKLLTLHASHRPDAVKRQYRLYCQALKQFEMGEPQPALRELYKSLSA